jgi:hypothetical protein
MSSTAVAIDRTRLAALIRREQATFAERIRAHERCSPRPARRCLAAYR